MRDIVLHGDCLEIMPTLPAASVDLVLCDLPYGTTRNTWDSVVPLEPLWAHYRRLLTADGVVVLTAQMPFTAVLAASNLAWLRYDWVWHKTRPGGFLDARRRPLRAHENVLVFAPRAPRYRPQFSAGQPYRVTGTARKSGHNYGPGVAAATQEYGARRFPTSVLTVASEGCEEHPTQKPVALFAYLIRTYTSPGDLVLDNCAGSGTTGVACVQEGRQYILIEQDARYCEIARRRIAHEHEQQTGLLFAGVAT